MTETELRGNTEETDRQTSAGEMQEEQTGLLLSLSLLTTDES